MIRQKGNATEMNTLESRLNLPPGFTILLRGFARAVVTTQPENIKEFGTFYFLELLRFKSVNQNLGLQDLIKEFNSKCFSCTPLDLQKVLANEDPICVDHVKLLLNTEDKLYETKEEFSSHNQETQDNISTPSPPCSPRAESAEKSCSVTDMEHVVEHFTRDLLTPTGLNHDIQTVPMGNEVVIYRRNPHRSIDNEGVSTTPVMCKRTSSAIYEKISLSEIDVASNTVVIRTPSVPCEYMIVVHSENVPETIMFQKDPLSNNEEVREQTFQEDTVQVISSPADPSFVDKSQGSNDAGQVEPAEDPSLISSSEVQPCLNREAPDIPFDTPSIDPTKQTQIEMDKAANLHLPAPLEQVSHETEANNLPQVTPNISSENVSDLMKKISSTSDIPPKMPETKQADNPDLVHAPSSEGLANLSLEQQTDSFVLPQEDPNLLSSPHDTANPENPAIPSGTVTSLLDHSNLPQMEPAKQAGVYTAECPANDRTTGTPGSEPEKLQIFSSISPPSEMAPINSVPQSENEQSGHTSPRSLPSKEEKNFSSTTSSHIDSESSLPGADSGLHSFPCSQFTFSGKSTPVVEKRAQPEAQLPPGSYYGHLHPTHLVPGCSHEAVHRICQRPSISTTACKGNWRLCHLTCPETMSNTHTVQFYMNGSMTVEMRNEYAPNQQALPTYHCSGHQWDIPALCTSTSAMPVQTTPFPRHNCCCRYATDVTPTHYLLINSPCPRQTVSDASMSGTCTPKQLSGSGVTSVSCCCPHELGQTQELISTYSPQIQQ